MSDSAARVSLPRRRLLLGGAAVLGATGLSGAAATAAPAPALLTSDSGVRDPFTLGVASGDPLPDGVVLWTRLAPEPLRGGGMPDRTVSVQWQVATDRRFRDVVAEGVEPARPEWAHSVHVEVDGLRSASEYFYRFRVGRDISPVGHTKTAPAYWQPLQQMRFAFTSCQSYASGYFSPHDHMAEEDLDLVVQLGDYIYEGPPRPWMIRLHSGEREPFTLPEYRNRHAQYKTDSQLQRAHAAFPWAVIFDDHEVDNDWAADIAENPGEQPLQQFRARRAAAFQAYYEHMPLRRTSMPSGASMQAYRRLTYGSLATLHMIDTRQYRSDQIDVCKPKNRNKHGYCEPMLSEDRTMLGDEQERWLLDGLGGSATSWNILANQMMFTPIDRDPKRGTKHREFNLDGWDG